MHMRIDDMGNPHVLAGGERDVFIHVIGSCIDDSAPTERAAAEQVRGASAVEVVKGSEDHEDSLEPRSNE